MIFGRQLSDFQSKRILVDFKLPDLDEFSCLSQDDLVHLKIQMNNLPNMEVDLADFSQTEVEIMLFLKDRLSCTEICDNGIDDDNDGWIDCNDPDCIEEASGQRSNPVCSGQAVFREDPDQKFGFDDNQIKGYPTYTTVLGDGIPWKSLGIGEEDKVIVEFSNQLILSDLQYRATGVQIVSGNIPQNFQETITIVGNSLTQNATIEVLDIAGNVLGGLMIKVLPKKARILNLVLVKLPTEANYPNVNFTIQNLTQVLDNCFKQINTTWTVNAIDQYNVNFDSDNNGYLDSHTTPGEDYWILHQYLRLNYTNLYTSRYYPTNVNLLNSTATFILYNKIQNSTGFPNGWAKGTSLAVTNCTYQHNKRTICHENGHLLGYQHPWEEFPTSYKQFDDAGALMDYLGILTGFKIRAYQWKN